MKNNDVMPLWFKCIIYPVIAAGIICADVKVVVAQVKAARNKEAI